MGKPKPHWGRPLRYHPRRIWLAPTVWITLAIVMGVALTRIDFLSLVSGFTTSLTPGVEVPVLSSIASGMMALTAIVFSLAFVFVQFGSSAYSPRLVSFFTTDRVVTNALGIFTGTFLYALVGLILLTPSRPPSMTWLVAVTSMVWLLVSILFFVLLVQRINKLTIANVLHMVGDRGRGVIESTYPLLELELELETDALQKASVASDSAKSEPGAAPAAPNMDIAALPPPNQTLQYVGGPVVVVEFHIQLLVELARRADAVIEIKYAVGDVMTDASDVLYVRGGKRDMSEFALRQAIALGFERTIEQDPKYALRLLVDVGIKALSPAVNDPTTAVMALNEISDLLGRIGRRRLDVGHIYDKTGALRLIYPTPTWEDFLSLGIDEIRFYGANSYQVMRRLRAMLADLEHTVPEGRRAAIEHQATRTEVTIGRTFADTADLLEAQQSDRQGIGLSRPLEIRQTMKAT